MFAAHRMHLLLLLYMCGLLLALSTKAQTQPSAVTESAGPIVNTSAALNGSVTPNGLNTVAWFEWGRTIGYGNTTPYIDAGNGTMPVSVSQALTNLLAGTIYHYRVVASNSLGIATGANKLFWSIPLEAKKLNPFTNELHTPFQDPGPRARPLSILTDMAVKADGTLAQWGSGTYVASNPDATNLIAVAKSSSFVGLRVDGTVKVWPTNAPMPPADVTNVVAISGGTAHLLALRGDRTLVAWGSNGSGVSTIPAGATNVTTIAAGHYHNLVLRADGSVIAWGYNSQGQANVPPDLTNAVAISAGAYHSLAVRSDGSVVGWGGNSWGQINVPAEATNVMAVGAGAAHSIALRKDGSVVAWGRTNYQTVPPEVTNVLTIATRGAVNAALTRDGRVLNWGDLYDFYGKTNIPANIDALSIPVATSSDLNVGALGEYSVTYRVTNSVGAVSTATRTVVVVPERPVVAITSLTNVVNTNARLTGSVDPRGVATTAWFEWGTRTRERSASFEVGDGTTPLIVGTNISSLIPGLHYHCRLVASNAFWIVHSEEREVWVPAIAYSGGNPQTNECHTAFQQSAIATAAPLAISADDHINYVLRADRTAFGWGASGEENPALTMMPPDLTNLSAVIVGGNLQNVRNFGVALSRDGTVRAWGRNDFGQTNVPDSATNVVEISAGDGHTLALRRDGTVVAWGYNNGGQTNVPASATNVIQVSAGGYHSVALRADGSLVPWGSIPPAATNLTKVAAGYDHDLGLRPDGTILGWGGNYYGQITIPAFATNVIEIAAGYYFSMALRADGSVVAWGHGDFGKTSVPADATNVIAIAAAEHHALALRADGKLLAWGLNNAGQTEIPEAVRQLTLAVHVEGSVDTNTPGVYPLAYTATNELGAIGSVVQTVVVADTLKPAITLLGPAPSVVLMGDVFEDPGWTAFDLCGGDLTQGTVRSGAVDSTKPGQYTLTYTVSDASGLTGSTNRDVFVVQRPAVFGATIRVDGSFAFSFTNTPGAPFRVLACDHLPAQPEDWIEAGSVSEGPPGLFHFADIQATNYGSRYYRVASPIQF